MQQVDYSNLALLKRNKVLPLRVSLWMYQRMYRKRKLNQYCDIPYWFTIVPPLALILLLLIISAIQNGVTPPPVVLRVIGSVSTIILIQLLASEAVNRKVIYTFTKDISPPVSDDEIWNKLDAPLRGQIVFPILGVIVGLPLVILYSKELFPIDVKIDTCFVLGLCVVLFNTSYGMFMHIFSSMSLVNMTSYFSDRLYEFFPTGSPVIRHLANLYSTALLLTIITSIATISVVVIAFPTPIMHQFAAISLVSAIGIAIAAFLYHLHSINMLIQKGKENAIARIQDRINQLNNKGSSDSVARKDALEEIGNLIDISEKIQNAKPKILSIDITLKYIFSIVSPLIPLANNEYLKPLKTIMESLKDL